MATDHLHSPTVVVPIFNAYDALVACVESIVLHTAGPYRVILIDDASSDARISPWLAEQAREHDWIEHQKNEENCGFTLTVNRGLVHASGDVVILNSDTIVTEGWLDRLIRAAYSRSEVATVTPLSNAAGAFSIPELNEVNEVPSDLGPEGMARVLRSVSRLRYPESPTGNGFCMYIRRAALDRVGLLDADHFPRGYGEENDFCMRARAQGMFNLIDDSTFIAHERGSSFGNEREALMQQGRETLRRLHPAYSGLVRTFLDDPYLAEVRTGVRTMLEARESSHDLTVRAGPEKRSTRKRALTIVHAGSGGTIHTNQDMISALDGEFEMFLLVCGLSEWKLYSGTHEMPIQTIVFGDEWQAAQPTSRSRGLAMHALLRAHEIDLVHIRNFICTGPETVPWMKLAESRILVSFHDFAAICPTIQLLDHRGEYCAGHCTRGDGECPTSHWFSGFHRLKHEQVYGWRLRMSTHLRLVDGYVTTSQVAKDLVSEHFPFLEHRRFDVIEHGRDRQNFRACAAPPRPKEQPVRVISFGALNFAKGSSLLEELMKRNRRESGNFEFHVAGDFSADFRPDLLDAVVHGSYERDQLPDLLDSIRPSFCLVTSIWPETYCHTLTEAWFAGIPVIASDIGVLRERIGRHGGGWLVDYRDARAWYKRMTELAWDQEEWSRVRRQVQAITLPDARKMGASYAALYRDILQAT